MKYIVYLTINTKSQINGINRIYIGVHKVYNPEIFDGYIGCAVKIQQPSTYMYPKTPFQHAVKKYGPSAFKRETLYIYDTAEEAYNKEAELIDLNFIKQPHVYNACLGGFGGGNLGRTIYQFDFNGNLLKKWECAIEAYEFYGLPREKFNYAIFNKHPLVDSLWSNSETIDITEYTIQAWGEPKVTHLYSKEGKWIKEFVSRKECGEYLGIDEASICSAIKRQSCIAKQFYVTDFMVDEFIPKARKYYQNMTFYVYKNYKFLKECVGKELLNVIEEHSWNKIRDKLRSQNCWIKDFYISETKVEESEIPPKKIGNGTAVDIYTKYGDYIETIYSMKEVKKKYNIPSSVIKNIQLGDRYYEDYIFKYHSKK